MYYVIPGTIDESMNRILIEKAEEAEQTLGVDGQVDQVKVLLGETEEESTADFMARMAEKWREQ
jgi:hypothetical protein